MDGSSAGPRSGPAELLVRLYRRFLETAPTAPHLTYDLVAGASASAERRRKLVAAAFQSLARRRRVAEIRTNSLWSLERWPGRQKARRDFFDGGSAFSWRALTFFLESRGPAELLDASPRAP